MRPFYTSGRLGSAHQAMHSMVLSLENPVFCGAKNAPKQNPEKASLIG
jgi:hypothetical protein